MQNVVMRTVFVSVVLCCLCGCRETWRDGACHLPPPPPACTCAAPTHDAVTVNAAESSHAPRTGIMPVFAAWHNLAERALTPLRQMALHAPVKQNATAPRGNRTRKPAPPKAIPEGTCIDINQGTVQELMMLPGVGQGRAEAIVAARAKRPFRRRSDITRIRGIGKKTFRRMESAICPI